MDWMQIGSAVLLVAFLFFIAPRAVLMLKNSPKGSSQDWMTASLLLGAVALFVFILIKMV